MTAFVAVVFEQGSTPRLRFRLLSRNVLSGEITVRPDPSDTVEWSIAWPGDTVVKTTAAGGGLLLDPVTRVVEYPLAVADIAAIGAGVVVPFAVRVINADGQPYRYLDGTITTKGTWP